MSTQKKTSAKNRKQDSIKSTAKSMFTSRIRSVGNSKGVILNNSLIKIAGLNLDADIMIEASEGIITIAQARPKVNTDLKTWDAQFKKAIKAGEKPEGDLFEGLANEFDKTEW